jgi:hypothetical protein
MLLIIIFPYLKLLYAMHLLLSNVLKLILEIDWFYEFIHKTLVLWNLLQFLSFLHRNELECIQLKRNSLGLKQNLVKQKLFILIEF